MVVECIVSWCAVHLSFPHVLFQSHLPLGSEPIGGHCVFHTARDGGLRTTYEAFAPAYLLTREILKYPFLSLLCFCFLLLLSFALFLIIIIIIIVKWYMKCFIYWTADMKSSELWSSQFKQLRKEAWKSQDFNGVWTRDLAIPVRRSNQLSYEATDVRSWSFVSSNKPVKNGCEVIYEMLHILNCEYEIKWAMIIAVTNAI